jgi:hypothetical protein
VTQKAQAQAAIRDDGATTDRIARLPAKRRINTLKRTGWCHHHHATDNTKRYATQCDPIGPRQHG